VKVNIRIERTAENWNCV